MFAAIKSFILVALTVVVISISTVTATYIETGDCEDKTCVYDYSLSGEIQDKRAIEESVLSGEVTLRCESEGTFNGQDAMYYCIELANFFQRLYEIGKIDKTANVQRKRRLKFVSDVTSLMSNRFCFVRNTNGKLLTVFHPANETNQVVNLKKTIVSSFQANFDKTTEEMESDPQSIHKAHYSYESKGKSTVEHRSVGNQDVVKYSGNTKKRNVDYNSEEDVEIDEDNVIRHSSGTSTTSLSKEDKSEEKPQENDQDIPPIEVMSHYTLNLVECLSTSTMSMSDYDYYAKNYANKWDYEPVMDSLVAKIDERAIDLEEMEDLSNQLEDLTQTVKRMVRDTSSYDQSGHIESSLLRWKKILHLESKYGAPTGRKSKLNMILNDLEKVSSDDFSHNIHVRLIIYNLLSSEGSLAAQQALLNALKLMSRRDQEYDSIVMAITLLHSVNRSTLLDFKDYMMNNMNVDEELLLSFATLGRHKNVEQEVVNTIAQLIDEKGANDTDSLIYFIHALGNTGSKLIIPHLIPYLMDNNKDIQLTAIDALRTVSTDKEVQKKFTGLIASDTEYIDVILAIIDSLKFPYESFLYYPEPPEEPEDEEVEKKLLMSIVNATVHFHDDALYSATVECLKAITSNDFTFTTQLLNELVMHYAKQTRDKRSYSNRWTSRDNEDYDLIASYYSRSSDSNKYPYNRALLWAKRIGPSKVHARLAAGGFSGIGLSSGYKVYGKGVFKVYCFGETYTAVDAEYNSEYSISSRRPTVRKYVKVLGKTYIPRSRTITANMASTELPYSNTWSRNLSNLPLFYLTVRLYVKVGFLSFTVRGTANLKASFTLGLQNSQANAELAVQSSITITGGADLNIGLIKIGLDVSGSVGYYISPKAKVTLCGQTADANSCFGVFHSSEGLSIGVTAYWRRRCIFGCTDKWTPKSTVLGLSGSTTVSSFPEKILWGQCTACTCGSNSLVDGLCQYIQDGRDGNNPITGGLSGCSCQSLPYQ